MSDDQPTRRFDRSDPAARGSDSPDSGPREPDAPTERFEQAPLGAAAGDTRPTAPQEKKRQTLMITLISIIALLVVALIVLVIVWASRDNASAPAAAVSSSASASASPTPSPTPSATPTASAPSPTPPPVTTGPSFTSFSPNANSTVHCPDANPVPLTFTWSSSGATKAWIGVGTTNAKTAPFAEVDPTDTYKDISFQCSNASEIYTVTLEDAAGNLMSHTVKLVRVQP